MIKRLAMTIAFAGLSGAAVAADLLGPIIDIPTPTMTVAGFSWTGGYVGANVGVGTADANYSYSASQAASYSPGYYNPPTPGYYTPSSPGYYTPAYYNPGFANSGSEHERSGGVVGGIQAGYNYAFGSGGFGGFGGFGGGAVPIIGVEADFDGSGVHSGGTLGGFASGNITGSPLGVGATTDLLYFGTVRGRFGLAFDRLFVFGTGGFAYGETSTAITSQQAGVYTTKSNFHTGYAYGGGVEYAITNNLALRAEYLHLDLNRKSVSSGGDGCGCTTYNINEKPSLDLVRAGLDYKFDFARAVAGPVIARY